MNRIGATAMLSVALAMAGPATVAAQSPGREAGYRATDPVSGVEVRIDRVEPEHAAFEIVASSVSVRKVVRGLQSETIVKTPDDALTIRVTPASIAVEQADGSTVTARPGEWVAARRITERLAGSPAVSAALGVLRAVSHQSASPIAHAVASTRILLMTLSGDRDGARRLGQAVSARQGASLAPVLAVQTAGECWDAYVEEAVEAYMEYEDCVDSKEWWDVGGMGACLIIYEMRAIGAFAWWASCVGLKK